MRLEQVDVTKPSYAFWMWAQDMDKKKRAEREDAHVEQALAGPPDVQALMTSLDADSFDSVPQPVPPTLESPKLPTRTSVPPQTVFDRGVGDALPKVRLQKRSRLERRDGPRSSGEHFL